MVPVSVQPGNIISPICAHEKPQLEQNLQVEADREGCLGTTSNRIRPILNS
jgi:hypothetical protein